MNVIEYKCPNCTADLKFDIESQKLRCEYCDSFFTKDEIETLLRNKKGNPVKLEKDHKEPGVYTCSSCGAQIIAAETQTALFCHYCHSPVILSGKFVDAALPQKIISFKVSKERATEAFKSWCFKRFVPHNFKNEMQLKKIVGLYVPFWLADCKTKTLFSAMAKVITREHTFNYDLEITWEYALERDVSTVIKNVASDGSKGIDDALMHAIEPFDYSALEDFSMSYLSGFYAEKYDVDKAEVFPQIKKRVKEACSKIIEDSIKDYNVVENKKLDCTVESTEWTYALLPVWFMTYEYKGKLYKFVQNAQNSNIAGILPLSKTKLYLVCASIFAGVSVVASLLGALFAGGIF